MVIKQEYLKIAYEHKFPKTFIFLVFILKVMKQCDLRTFLISFTTVPKIK